MTPTTMIMSLCNVSFAFPGIPGKRKVTTVKSLRTVALNMIKLGLMPAKLVTPISSMHLIAMKFILIGVLLIRLRIAWPPISMKTIDVKFVKKGFN